MKINTIIYLLIMALGGNAWCLELPTWVGIANGKTVFVDEEDEHFEGANCYNVALRFLGVYHGFFQTGPMEYKYYQKFLCQKINESELSFGDLVAFKSLQSSNFINEDHAAIFLSKDLWLSKNGGYASVPIEIQSAESVRRAYLEVVSDRPVPRWIEYYRCRSTDELFKTYANLIPPDTKQLWDKMIKIEEELAELLIAENASLYKAEIIKGYQEYRRISTEWIVAYANKILHGSEDSEILRHINKLVFLRLSGRIPHFETVEVLAAEKKIYDEVFSF